MKAWRLWVISALFAANSWAVIPENGWWWASNESGRGFNIEVQNNTLFFASFAYDFNGAPIWYTSGGQMTSDRDYSGQLFRTASGQCFGCGYVAPVVIPAGTMSLHFTSSQTATLTINGFAISVKRFDFWLNEVTPDAMMGEWSAVIGAASDLFDAERIDYSTKVSDSTGTFLGGHRLGSSASLNPAVVSYDSGQGVWSALLDSSTSYFRYFVFRTTGFNRVEGSFWLYQKGSSPVGSGTFYQAFRTASAALIQTGSGPGSSKSTANAELLNEFEQRDTRLFYKLSAENNSVASSDVVEGARTLEAMLEKYSHRQP